MISGNGKNLEQLRLICVNSVDANDIFRKICLNLTQLKRLQIVCYSLVSLDLMSGHKNLDVLDIHLKEDSLIIPSVEDYEIKGTDDQRIV